MSVASSAPPSWRRMVVEAILNGEQAAGVTVKSLTVDGRVPMAWKEQPRTFRIDVS